jgi:hypothetical protein
MNDSDYISIASLNQYSYCDRHCYNGLWDYCNELGDREIYQPLADELQFQRQQIEPLLKLQN